MIKNFNQKVIFYIILGSNLKIASINGSWKLIWSLPLKLIEINQVVLKLTRIFHANKNKAYVRNCILKKKTTTATRRRKKLNLIN
jgi:hypothetical protein